MFNLLFNKDWVVPRSSIWVKSSQVLAIGSRISLRYSQAHQLVMEMRRQWSTSSNSPAFLSLEDPGWGQSCRFDGKRLSGHRRSPHSIHSRDLYPLVPSQLLRSLAPCLLTSRDKWLIPAMALTESQLWQGWSRANFPVVLFFSVDLRLRSHFWS